MADVFISYAREDRPRAEQIARMLSAMGLECFWDTEIPPGQTWSDYIEGKLSAARVVIVLWSQHSTRSQWVREEARMGREKSKLIPAIIDGSPSPLGFGEVQAADLTGWNGEAHHPQWLRFANAVLTAAGGAASTVQTASMPQPAPSAWRASSPAAGGMSEHLSPVGYVQKCFRFYFNGKGRARRTEYWWWIAFVVIASLVATVLDMAISGVNPLTGAPNSQVVYAIVALALLPPGVSVLSRRFHDVGLNGWLVGGAFAVYAIGAVMLAMAVPAGVVLVGAAAVAILVVALIPSKPGANQYGPNPKGV